MEEKEAAKALDRSKLQKPKHLTIMLEKNQIKDKITSKCAAHLHRWP